MANVRTEDRDGGVRLLVLDRAPANAITVELVTDLAASMRQAADDDAVRAIVLTAAGAFFSGGIDLRTLDGHDDRDDVLALFRAIRATVVTLLELPRPTIAMLNGHAIAGGLVLALTCDYRLGVAGDYRIGLNEVPIGASFPRAALEVVRLRLPHARAAELMLGGALYPAEQGLRLGVVDELLPRDTVDATVVRRAARLGSYPREAYVATKRALAAEALARIRAETPNEERAHAAVWASPASVAARRAQRAILGL